MLSLGQTQEDLENAKEIVRTLYKNPKGEPFELTNFQAIIFDAIYRKLKDRLAVLTYTQFGKEIAHETPILTTKGWKKHGDLVVGDYVYSDKGKPVKVNALLAETNKSEYEIEFSNGEKIVAHGKHEWIVKHRGWKDFRKVETEWLFNQPLRYNGVRCNNFVLPEIKPIENVRNTKRSKTVTIKSITKVEPRVGRCISVDGGIYLAGKKLIPTHNSDTVAMAVLTRVTTFAERWVIIGGSEDKARIIMNRLIDHIFDNDYTKSKLTLQKHESLERLRHERSRTRVTFNVGGSVGEVFILSGDSSKKGEDAGDILVGHGSPNVVCISKGFNVLTDKGEIEISKLVKDKKASKIYSFNHKTKKIELQNILKYQENKLRNKELIEINLGDRKFVCTEEHPVWVEGKGYIPAKDVKINDKCLLYDN